MTPIPPAPKAEAYHPGTPNEKTPSGGLFTSHPTRASQTPSSHRVAAAVSLAILFVALVIAIPRSSNQSSPAAGPSGCTNYAPLAPTGSGVVRQVSNQTELATALGAAKAGDTINLASGRYEQLHYRQGYGHQSGLADRPVVIQAAAGAEPIIGGASIDPANSKPAVDVVRVEHVTIRGLRIGNAMFGARSSASHHVTFEYNELSDVGHSAIITQAFWSDQSMVSSNTTIRCNTISRTGKIDPEYGEGIYIGTGTFSVTDKSHDILVEYNELHDLSNEAIDVKHNTTNVTIRRNRIHDVTPNYGGAISLGLNRSNWGPANYLVEGNQIWNVSNGMHYAQAIAVAHGPTEIRNNTIWNVDVDRQSTWPGKHVIQVHGDDNPADWASAFGSPANNQVSIVDNTIHGCSESCISSYADPSAIAPEVNVEGNVVTAASAGLLRVTAEAVVGESDFVGPTVGPADSGSGPGSGLALRTSVETTTSTSTTTTTIQPVAADTSTSLTTTSPPTTTTTTSTRPSGDEQTETTNVAGSSDEPDADGGAGDGPPISTERDRTTTVMNPAQPLGSSDDTSARPTTSVVRSTDGPSTTVPGSPVDSDETDTSTTADAGSDSQRPPTTSLSGDSVGPIPATDDLDSESQSTSSPEDVTIDDSRDRNGDKPGRRRGQNRSIERRRGTPPRTTTTQPGRNYRFSHDGWHAAASTRST